MFDLSTSLKALATVFFLIATRWIYRITLHPLAKFPGPKLAAMTSIYSMSYDLPLRTSYVKQFAKWHQQYASPIIRIEPNHLHILDMDAYNQVFRVGTPFSRDPAMYSFPFTKGGLFNKLTVKEVKPHRDLYMPYFSRQNVQKMEPIIRDHLSKFLIKLDEASYARHEVDLSLGFRCLNADTVMRYAFDKPYGALGSPNFEFPMILALEDSTKNITKMWYFPNIMGFVINVLKSVPRKWIPDENLAAALGNLDASPDKGCTQRIRELKAESKGKMTPSVFQTALHPNPDKGHPVLSNEALGADAFTLFTGGTDTTANALVVGTWALVKDPVQLHKLRSSLRKAIPDPNQMNLSWAALEQIDYLRGVVKESLRLSYGVPGKIPRQTPPGGATMCNQHIPEGTMLSMAAYVYHTHESFFDRPTEFLPERWLGSSALTAENHLISFSRGSRNCLGLQLAYAELFYTFAYLFRRFNIMLSAEMEDGDMEWHDAFLTAFFGHLKVKAERLDD